MKTIHHKSLIHWFLYFRKPFLISAVLGLHNLSDFTTAEVITVNYSVIHQNWTADIVQNDIALLKLVKNATLGTNVDTVKLASGSDSYTGQIGTTIGWGLTENNSMSYVLKSVQSPVISNQICNASYGVSITLYTSLYHKPIGLQVRKMIIVNKIMTEFLETFLEKSCFINQNIGKTIFIVEQALPILSQCTSCMFRRLCARQVNSFISRQNRVPILLKIDFFLYAET